MELDTQNLNQEAAIPPAVETPVAESPAMVPPEVTGFQDQIDDQRLTIDRLEKELAALRLGDARKEASKSTKLGTVAQELRRDAAIRACGGLARWNTLTPSRRAELLGAVDSANVTDAELMQFFGPKSNGMAASQLAKADPERYRRYRILSRERGLF